MLIRAIPLVLKQVPQTIFIIGGGGEQRDYLKNLANSLGVSSAIRFVGWIPHDELPKYLASSDVYVSTSLSDSTSLSLQEAMACELPPVVTDLPANREWVLDGENGFIVHINDKQILAERIVYLIENKEVMKKFGKSCREIIKEKAEYKKEMGKVEELYKELVKK
jgi:glycosyltransferase involved in cell wall biosynthesis